MCKSACFVEDPLKISYQFWRRSSRPPALVPDTPLILFWYARLLLLLAEVLQ